MKSMRASSTVFSVPGNFSLRRSVPFLTLLATSVTPVTNALKSSPRETKSVWQLTSTMTPFFASGEIQVRTSPSAATRPAREAALTVPFLRRTSTALSMSPPASTRALLQSLMPAWVRSRSSLTIDAVMSAMFKSSNVRM